MEIQHTFKTKSHDLKSLFKKNKLSSFINELKKQAEKDPDRYPRDKYVGDGFEFFVELLLKLMPYDNRLGLHEYSPKQVDDNGVDGLGYNLDGELSVIQVKFRGNSQKVLTGSGDKLGNLVSDGLMAHDVGKPQEGQVPRHYVITTAKGLHHYTDNQFFKGKVKCIGYDDLRSLVDGNVGFWDMCRKLLNEELC